MSHFTVAIFTDGKPDYSDITRILEPYNEQTENPEFLEFEMEKTAEELRAEWEEDNDGCETFEEYAENSGYYHDEKSDSYGYLCNPDARWDWWTIGGRWDGLLPLKMGAEKMSAFIGDSLIPLMLSANCSKNTCDCAPLRSVDFNPDMDAYQRAIRFWEIIVEGQPLREGEKEPWSMWKPEYYIQQFGNKEEYAFKEASLTTYAFVDLNGEWNETGTMGWFGIDNATAESREAYNNNFQQTIKDYLKLDNVWITVVDCHI